MPCDRPKTIDFDDLNLRFASRALVLGESLTMIARLPAHSRVHTAWEMPWPRAGFWYFPERSLADTCGVGI